MVFVQCTYIILALFGVSIITVHGEDQGRQFYRDAADCSIYYQCANGLAYKFQCQAPLVFRLDVNVCDFIENVPECKGLTPTSSPGPHPTQSPTSKPTPSVPTSNPTYKVPTPKPTSSHPKTKAPTSESPTAKPTPSVPTSNPTYKVPTPKPTSSHPKTKAPSYPKTKAPSADKPTLRPTSGPDVDKVLDEMISILKSNANTIDQSVFVTQLGQPSKFYHTADLIEALHVMATTEIAGSKFALLGDKTYGLANLALFLGQSMQETIQYDACDENSWDLVNGHYPISNGCGQLGQSYQDYECNAEEKHMECPLNPLMELKGTTHATWYGAPKPFYCGPKSKYPSVGYWDYSAECNQPWASPPVTCQDYDGQKAGKEIPGSYANSKGRTDVENCCWWGRGVIQTTGRCNFGKLNYYLGKKAADEGRSAPYATHDFCADPGSICSDQSAPELKWIAGFFYWETSVQNWADAQFNYLDELKKFVDNGMVDTSLIDKVSGIVNRGCPALSCPGSGAVDAADKRRANTQKVLHAFFQMRSSAMLANIEKLDKEMN